MTIAAVVLFDLCMAVLCVLKGKLWTGFFGIFIPLVGIVGASRLARPTSPWARRRYRDKPGKLAKAQRREDRIDRTWRAWREAFFDLVAGKPHLSSISSSTPQGVAGSGPPREDGTTETAEPGPARRT